MRSTILISVACAACLPSHVRPRPANADCVTYDLVFRQTLVGNDRWSPPELLGFADPGKISGEYAACPPSPAPPEIATSIQEGVAEVARVEDGTPTTIDFRGFNGERPNPAVPLASATPSGPERTETVRGGVVRILRYRAFFRGCLFKVFDLGALGAHEECQPPAQPSSARS